MNINLIWILYLLLDKKLYNMVYNIYKGFTIVVLQE